jgi:hypothetical protein
MPRKTTTNDTRIWLETSANTPDMGKIRCDRPSGTARAQTERTRGAQPSNGERGEVVGEAGDMLDFAAVDAELRDVLGEPAVA